MNENIGTAASDSNPMGTMPVKKLLLKMAFPIMISMIINALYNIVDSVFVAELGESATNAVNLSFSIQNLMIAFSVGASVGINSITSRRLGEGRPEEARRTANTGLFLQLTTSLLFAVFGLFFSDMFFGMYKTTDEIAELGSKYLSVCTTFSFGMFTSITIGGIMQCIGKSVYQMIIQMMGAIINVILDPLLIFGLWGFPKLGVAGAAVATVTGQIISAIFALYINYKINRSTPITLGGILRPSIVAVRDIYNIGFPAILMQSLGSIMILAMNGILITLHNSAVWIFGIFFKLQSFVLMPLFGVTNSLVPIVGYNFGARKKERIKEVIKFAVILGMCIMGTGTLAFQLIPGQLLSMFQPTEETLAMGIAALRILSLAYVFAGMAIILSSSFQAMGKAIISLFINVVRQIVFLLPIAYILSKTVGLPAVWFSMPLAEVFATTFAVIMFVRIKKNIIDRLDTHYLE